VTIDGQTLTTASDSVGLVSGGLVGPWVISVPRWAQAVRVDGCGPGGGGGPSTPAAQSGGGGGSGVFIFGATYPVIGGEQMTVEVPDGVTSGVNAIDTETRVIGSLFQLRLPGGEAGQPGGQGGRSGYWNIADSPHIGGLALPLTTPGAHGATGVYGPPAMTDMHDRLMPISGHIGASAGHGGAANSTSRPGTPQGPHGYFRGTINVALGSGANGGMTPFSRIITSLGGPLNGPALDVNPVFHGFGMGGAGGGTHATVAQPGGRSGPGLVILRFLEGSQCSSRM